MNYAVVSIKLDPKTKKEAHKAAAKVGVPLSTILKGYIRDFIKTETVTFRAREPEIPNARTAKILRQAEKDWKEGKHSPIFETGEEAVAWLEKQGI